MEEGNGAAGTTCGAVFEPAGFDARKGFEKVKGVVVWVAGDCAVILEMGESVSSWPLQFVTGAYQSFTYIVGPESSEIHTERGVFELHLSENQVRLLSFGNQKTWVVVIFYVMLEQTLVQVECVVDDVPAAG